MMRALHRPVSERRLAARARGARLRAGRAAGFTLLEIMVVIALIGLLLGLVAVAVGRQTEAGRIAEGRSRIEQFALLLESYRDKQGDYPPDRLAALGVRDSNPVNEGIEAPVAALRSASYGGRRPEERWMANGDQDSSKQLKSADGSAALLELTDPWDNPMLYIVSRDYGETFTYRVMSDAGTEDVTLRAATNPTTGAPWQFDTFQLRSAGPDGVFGTDDDLANYEIAPSGE